MRSVADQRQPFADEGARDEVAERKGPRLVERFDLAEVQAEPLLELGMEFIIRQSDDARGFRALLGPHQRRTLASQRQNCKRPGGQEVFFGTSVMIALMADGDDDTGLVIIPAMGRDARTLAQLRARAIGGDKKCCLDHAAIPERDADTVGP
jgi:hypothetical protein